MLFQFCCPHNAYEQINTPTPKCVCIPFGSTIKFKRIYTDAALLSNFFFFLLADANGYSIRLHQNEPMKCTIQGAMCVWDIGGVGFGNFCVVSVCLICQFVFDQIKYVLLPCCDGTNQFRPPSPFLPTTNIRCAHYGLNQINGKLNLIMHESSSYIQYLYFLQPSVWCFVWFNFLPIYRNGLTHFVVNFFISYSLVADFRQNI